MKTEKIRKQKGSVLFTVVAVMTLLVVFMAGTMILVSSANHRSHINYSTAQTTVTSRTVAESALKAIQVGNNDYVDYFFSVNEDNPRIEIPISINESDAAAGLGTMGRIDNVVVTYEGKMNFYSDGTTADDGVGDKAEKGWKERDIIKVLSTVNLGRANSSTAIYLVVDPPNGDPGGGGGGAGFVTTGGANFDCQTGLYGGAYINLPELSETANDDYTNPSTYRSGYDMTLVNAGSIAEADAVFNGNLKLGNSNGFIFPAKAKGVTVWGDMLFNTNDHFRAFVNTNNVKGTLKFNEIPFIYVDGKISVEGGSAKMQIAMKDIDGNVVDNVPLNIFCDYISTGDVNSSANNFDLKADVFCMGAGATSFIYTNGGSLEAWTSSVINKTLSSDAQTYIAGNYFSKGNLKVKGQNSGFVVKGDVRIEGDLDLSDLTNNKKFEVGGDLVVGGNLIGVTKDKLKVGGDIYINGTIDGYEKSLKDGVEIKEEIDPKYIKIEAAEGSWEERELKAGDFFDYEYDADGNATTIGGYGIEDEGYNWFMITNAVGEKSRIYNNTGKFYYAPLLDSKNIAGPYKQYTDESGDTGSNVKDPYYVECDKNGDPTGMPTEDEFWYYDSTDLLTDPPIHYTSDDVTEIKYYNADGDLIDESQAYGGSIKEVVSYKYSNIYPAYAEKLVVLGINGVGEVPKTDTKVVMTMQEVLENVVNPYENKGYPSQFEKLLTTAGALPTYSSLFDLYNDASENGAGQRITCTTKLNNISTVPLVKIDYDTNGAPLTDTNKKNEVLKGSYTINKSCILKNLNPGADQFGNNQEKSIIVNPAGGDIFIVIDSGVSLDDIKFVIDDVSSSNSVYFYIKENCSLTFGSTGTITTAKYMALINSDTSFQIATDGSLVKKGADGKADPKTLTELGYNNPNVFIYGDTGSKLDLANFTNIAANIVSPDITVNCTSTNGSGVSNTIYYNGTDISKVDPEGKWLMFGCCNSENTNFPNKVKVLFTPDTGDDDEDYSDEDRTHWLKVLYYDEF
ncbi:MAG: hypothetical protein IJ071_11730 [Ruminococcus sp.]|nr:hypothetical protein [Ruminococcus sp.]